MCWGRVSAGSGRAHPEREGPGHLRWVGGASRQVWGQAIIGWMDTGMGDTRILAPPVPIQGAFQPVSRPCSRPSLPQGPAL